jgi:uncharacterized membrane protein
MRFSWIAKLGLLGMAAWGSGKTVLADVQYYSYTYLPAPGGLGNGLPLPFTPGGINDSGQVVGYSFYQGVTYFGSSIAAPYDPSTYNILYGPGFAETNPLGINSSGQIVGVYFLNPEQTESQGFLYSSGAFTSLNYPGAVVTRPEGINDAGQIVGSFQASLNGPAQGFLYSSGKYSLIDDPGSTFTKANGINDDGQIVGSSSKGCFLYSGGGFIPIGSPCSAALGINDAGQVVGSAIGSGGFLYSDGSFVRTNIAFSQSNLLAAAQAVGINNSGQIVAFSQFSDGTTLDFVATPCTDCAFVPEPRTLPVLTASLLALFVLAWRRKRASRL